MIKKLIYSCYPDGLFNWKGKPASDKDITESVGIRFIKYPAMGDTECHFMVAKIYKLKSYKIIKGAVK